MVSSAHASTKSSPAPAGPASKPDAADTNKTALRGMSFEDQLAALSPSGGSAALPPAVRVKMERAFGADFSGVRVHAGSPEATKVGAQAFTRGHDIFFAPGQYQPESVRGQELIGHELTHVVQQGRGVGGGADGINQDAGLEKSADVAGAKAARGEVAGTGKSAKPASASKTIQRKKDDDIWARARDILRIGDREIDADLVRVLAGLLATYDEPQIKDALASVGPAAFTSVARGDTIIRHLALGLMPLLVSQGAEVCPDDALNRVLSLSLTLQTAGIKVWMVAPALRQELAVSGRIPGQIVTAFQVVPTLMTSGPQALALVDHVAAGGSAFDARRAVTCAGEDMVMLVDALTTLRSLVGVEGVDDLTTEKLRAVIGERAHLTSGVLRKNAVALAASSQDPTTALGQSRAFGYRPDFQQHAEEKGDEAKDKLELKRTRQIEEQAKLDKQSAIEKQGEGAFDKLNRREQITISGKGRQFGEMKARPKKGQMPGLEEVWSKFDEARGNSAKGDIEKIDEKKSEDLVKVSTEEGPAKKSEVTEEYRTFFAKVDFHPDALRALQLTHEDADEAERIIDAIVAAPGCRALFTDVTLDGAELERALGLAPAALAAAIAGGVSAANLKAFLTSDNRVSFFSALSGTVAWANVDAFPAVFGAVEKHIDSPTGRGHLVTLSGVDVPSDIVTMLTATPGKGVGVLAAIRGHALDVGSLLAAVGACSRLGLKGPATQRYLTGILTPNNDGPTLCEHVYVTHLAEDTKFGDIKAFIKHVSQLIDEGFLEVVKVGGWSDLNGDNKTWELRYEVQRVSNSHVEDDFVMHFHPEASVKDCNKVDTLSRWHFKAERHPGPHVRHQDAPPTIKGRVERSPTGN